MLKPEVKPVSRKSKLVIQEFGNEILIYDLIENKAFSLNETSALIWQICDGSKTISEIANQISQKLNSTVNEDFVWLALEQLKKDNLLENNSDIIAPFEDLSRREVIRKVGLASLVALPVISSLIAPAAVSAQSGCGVISGKPLGCACSAGTQCGSTCCGVAAGAEVCVAPDDTPVDSPCRASCECAGSSTCPSCSGFPRVCRTGSCPPAP